MDVQRGLAEIRQAVQPVGLAANHLQGPIRIVWHVLDHLLSLVGIVQHIDSDRVHLVFENFRCQRLVAVDRHLIE